MCTFRWKKKNNENIAAFDWFICCNVLIAVIEYEENNAIIKKKKTPLINFRISFIAFLMR